MNLNGEHPIFREPNSIYRGLTKREWLAGLALQGLIMGTMSNSHLTGFTVRGNVVAAIEYADTLLAELEEHS